MTFPKIIVEIANIISWAKADGKLKELAKTSDEYLSHYEQEQRARLEQQAKAKEEERIQRNRQYVQTLVNTITQGKIKLGDKELNIPAVLEVNTQEGKKVVPREELINYATQVNQYRMPDGSIVNATQYQIDKYMKNQSRSINDDIYEMISLFTGQDNSQILKAALNNEKAKTIRKKLKTKRNVDTTVYRQQGKPKLKLKYNK